MQSRKNKQDTRTRHLDKASLFFGIVAAILIVIGVVLNATDTPAIGVTDPNKYGQGGGKVVVVPGTGVILIGLFFAIFPLKDLALDLKGRFVNKSKQG